MNPQYAQQALANQQRHLMYEQKRKTGPEFCVKHHEANVGFVNREVVCNTCIFEKKLEQVKFVALMSKELRAEYNAAFEQYKSQINSVNGVDPNLVKQRATLLVQRFFSDLSTRVKNLQSGVMSRIRTSDSLKELEKILEQSREFFPDQSKLDNSDHFEREKKLFDEKIGKGRFAYLVKRQQFYYDLINSLDTSSSKMQSTIESSNR